MVSKFYQVKTEDSLKCKDYEEGAIYVCEDTKRIFFDPVNRSNRISISCDMIILISEDERLSIQYPVSDRLYFVIDSRNMYIYHDKEWITCSGKIDMYIKNERIIIKRL